MDFYGFILRAFCTCWLNGRNDGVILKSNGIFMDIQKMVIIHDNFSVSHTATGFLDEWSPSTVIRRMKMSQDLGTLNKNLDLLTRAP